MFHQAMNAATIPKTPPARFNDALGAVTPAVVWLSMYPVASMRKASQTVKSREEKATVERRVRSQRRKVKMNQPYFAIVLVSFLVFCDWEGRN